MMKIGQFVKAQVREILANCDANDHDELGRLLDAEYSKSTFNLNYQFCVDIDFLSPDQSKRYWTELHLVRSRTVRVCSQWFDTPRTRELFLQYLTQKGIQPQDRLQEVEGISEGEAPKRRSLASGRRKKKNSRYKGNAIGNAQNLVVRNILSNLGHESFSDEDWEQTKAEFNHRCAIVTRLSTWSWNTRFRSIGLRWASTGWETWCPAARVATRLNPLRIFAISWEKIPKPSVESKLIWTDTTTCLWAKTNKFAPSSRWRIEKSLN